MSKYSKACCWRICLREDSSIAQVGECLSQQTVNLLLGLARQAHVNKTEIKQMVCFIGFLLRSRWLRWSLAPKLTQNNFG
jgi:hypothetical protein